MKVGQSLFIGCGVGLTEEIKTRNGVGVMLGGRPLRVSVPG